MGVYRQSQTSGCEWHSIGASGRVCHSGRPPVTLQGRGGRPAAAACTVIWARSCVNVKYCVYVGGGISRACVCAACAARARARSRSPAAVTNPPHRHAHLLLVCEHDCRKAHPRLRPTALAAHSGGQRSEPCRRHAAAATGPKNLKNTVDHLLELTRKVSLVP